MQTFLPYADFTETAKCLDYKRLGKQRVEAKQIINIITGVTPNSGWRHHPIVKMWIGYDTALKKYFNDISQEWINRGYKHTMGFYDVPEVINYPAFVLDPDVHKRYKQILYNKNKGYYANFKEEENVD